MSRTGLLSSKRIDLGIVFFLSSGTEDLVVNVVKRVLLEWINFFFLLVSRERGRKLLWLI